MAELWPGSGDPADSRCRCGAPGGRHLLDCPGRLAEIRQRREAATPGPWDATLAEEETRGISVRWWLISRVDDEMGFVGQVPDFLTETAEFIAHAPEDITWLLLRGDRLEAMVRERIRQVDQLKDRLREIEWVLNAGTHCPACERRSHDPACWLWLAIREV